MTANGRNLAESGFSLGKHRVGPGQPCLIVAELGSNHDGELDRALRLIDAVAEAGTDAVKFQSFTAHGLVNRHLGSARDGAPAHPAYEILERLAVPEAWHALLKEHAESRGLIFLSAPFDEGRAALLDELGLSGFKLASGEITNIPFLRRVARYGRPLLLSTGLATLDEVRTAVATLRAAGNEAFALLHCVSQYPTPLDQVNLRAMRALAAFSPVFGLSDHSRGIVAPLGAVALGAQIIEKHVTDDRRRAGPDHGFALEMTELAELVARVRELEAALGDGQKRPTPAEMGERAYSFRGLYAAVDLRAGSVLSRDDLKCVRPAAALGPEDLERLVGRELAVDLPAHGAITWQDVV